jgi:hypothetical protein
MVEELARLVEADPAGTAKILERMLDAYPPNSDMEDKLKGLIKKLADSGFRAEAIRCTEKLRKSLAGILEFYKNLVATTSVRSDHSQSLFG